MPLRAHLTAITNVMDTALHAELLAQVSAEIPNTVAIVEEVDTELDFNCVMLALDLVGWIDPPCSVLGRYHANTDFLAHLIDTGQLHAVQNPAAGDLAVYLRDGAIRHVGILVADNRVRSKWGSGHTYEHGLWEVPDSYGDSVRYYSPIDGELAQELLKEFKGWA